MRAVNNIIYSHKSHAIEFKKTAMVCSNLFALHFAFMLHLTSRQHFLSSSSGATGNLVKINTKEKQRCDRYDVIATIVR